LPNVIELAGDHSEAEFMLRGESKSYAEQIISPAGTSVSVIRFEGDIAGTSKNAVLAAFHGLPKEASQVVLLDFTKVAYINSGGISLMVQLLMEADKAGQKVHVFGLSRHFEKVFAVAGIDKYAKLSHDQPSALASLT